MVKAVKKKILVTGARGALAQQVITRLKDLHQLVIGQLLEVIDDGVFISFAV